MTVNDPRPLPTAIPAAVIELAKEINDFVGEVIRNDLDLDDVLQLVSAGKELYDAIRLAIVAKRELTNVKPQQRIALLRKVLQAQRAGATTTNRRPSPPASPPASPPKE